MRISMDNIGDLFWVDSVNFSQFILLSLTSQPSPGHKGQQAKGNASYVPGSPDSTHL